MALLSEQTNIKKLYIISEQLPSVFGDYCLNRRQDLKPSTLFNYGKDLLQFFHFLQWEQCFKVNKPPSKWTIKDLQRINKNHVLLFIQSFDKKIINEEDIVGSLNNNVQRKICSIISFFTYLSSTTDKSYEDITTIKRGQVVISSAKNLKIMDDEELRNFFLSVCYGDGLSDRAKHRNEKLCLRNILIFMLLLDTGILVSELVNLNIYDVEPQIHMLSVYRDNKDILIPYSKRTAWYMDEYLNIRERQNLEEKALILSNQKKRISVRQLERLMTNYCIASGNDVMSFTPSIFRKLLAAEIDKFSETELYKNYLFSYKVQKKLSMPEVKNIKKIIDEISDIREIQEIPCYL